MSRFDIELSSWILMDGNYETTNFETGQIVRFAAEFYLPHFSVCSDPVQLKPVMRQPSRYHTVGEVIFHTENAWVLNLGEISAFREGPQNQVKLGEHVQGQLSLHVDPFIYYESLCKIPDIPPLIYQWLIESIEIDTTPLVDVVDERGQRVTMRNEARLSYETVNRVDFRDRNPETIGSWVLHCSKLDAPPSKTL
jgi:hypothetical protein